MEIIELTKDELKELEERLHCYDLDFIKYELEGNISIGVRYKGKVIGGIDACITNFHILYISTLFVEEEFRNKKIGSMLIGELENRAKKMGVKLIRVDTYDFQGENFYKKMNYHQVGRYTYEEDGFSESFFVKYL